MIAQTISIVIIGWGAVATSVYTHLTQVRERVLNKRNIHLKVDAIVARSGLKGREVGENIRILKSVNEFIEYASTHHVDIAVELIGGITDAYTVAQFCANNNIHLATANKALIATHGEEIFNEFGNKTMLRFEAAIAGGIPIVRTLRDSFMEDNMLSIVGILNGTTNFILSQMQAGSSQAEAIHLAQEKGFAEADPSLDIDGADPMQKLSILSRLAFGAKLDTSKASYEGLPNNLSAVDFEFCRKSNRSIKSTAIATKSTKQANAIEVRVHLSLLSREHPLASVNNEYNGVMLQCEFSANTNYTGPGAGGTPTASATLADIVEMSCAIQSDNKIDNQILLQEPSSTICGIDPNREMARYMRVELLDEPGVFSQICTVLGDHGININSVVQIESSETKTKTAQFLLGKSSETAMIGVLSSLHQNKKVTQNPLHIRILDSDD